MFFDADESCVYIMASASGTLYVGLTMDIVSRVREHKIHAFGGFTAKYRCHKLVYYEILPSLEEAREREYTIKGWIRQKKIRLLEKQNPTWCDLARFWDARIE